MTRQVAPTGTAGGAWREGGTVPALIFSDMDDTFLARDKTLPEGNRAALDLMAARGVGFVPCSGRLVTGLPAEVMAHPAVRYAIGSNGGSVVDVRTGEALREVLMPTALVGALYEAVAGLDCSFDVFVGGHALAERVRYDAMGGYGIDPGQLALLRGLREPHDATITELVAGLPGVEKVTLYFGTDATRDELRRRLGAFPEVGVTSSHPKNVEVMCRGVSKGEALAWLCGALGVDVARTVAFGDSENDIPMIVAAGDGVAMANAAPEVRAVADHVCGDCDEAGVGAYLASLLA